MSVQNLKQAFKLIEDNLDKGYIVGPIEEKLIFKAEQILNIKFPPSYRYFLKNYSCSGFNGLEIGGIINENFENHGIRDAVGITIDGINSKEIPSHFFYISDTGDGFYYYLDSSHVNEEGEYPVVIWAYGMDENKKEKVAEDFGEFLLEQVQQALRDDEE